MRAGTLTESIVFRRPVIVKDDFGAEQTGYEDCIRMRAQAKYNSGNRITEQHEIIASSNVTFTVRNQCGVDEKMRVVWQGREYLILSVNRERLRQSISIVAELVNE
jgi:head-tail adaptor